ncbi:MAG: DUF1840 domain-containing protein [Methylomonas sp.]|nr:DUF1840 domain-containing protein [Methylomonas sp.]
MLYKFKSPATADLILLEPQGRQMLQILGKEPAPRGIITVAQMPGAIAAIEAAVVADDERRAAERAQAQAEGIDPAELPEAVHLRQRAAPFLALLRRSMAAERDVVWGV